jgi:hemerythrin
MPLFRWSSHYAVYVPEIDAEHRALFLMGAELERAVMAGAPQDRLIEIVRAVFDHAEDHFAHEERLMRAARYHAFDWHKDQHDGLRRRLKQFAQRLEADDPEVAAELVGYLAHWLRDHITVTDRMMTASLRSFEFQHAAAS